MNQFPTVEASLALVAALYNGKLDRGGQPKAAHCARVVGNLPPHVGYHVRAAAAHHDTLEDFPMISISTLLGLGYSPQTVLMVKALTHEPEMSYDEYIDRLITMGDPGPLYVKLADNTDNICLKRRDQLSPEHRAWHVDRCTKVYYPTRTKLCAALKALTGEEYQ